MRLLSNSLPRRTAPAALLPPVLALCAVLAGCAASPPLAAGHSATATASPSATTLHALFDSAWEDTMRRYPHWATYVGDHRYGDRLPDASPQAEADAYAETRRQLQAARAIPRSALGATDRTSLDLFIHAQEEELLFEPLVGWRRLSLGSQGGFHTEFTGLLQASPTATAAQAQQVLARLADAGGPGTAAPA